MDDQNVEILRDGFNAFLKKYLKDPQDIEPKKNESTGELTWMLIQNKILVYYGKWPLEQSVITAKLRIDGMEGPTLDSIEDAWKELTNLNAIRTKAKK
jgi:hypothetical protein